MNHSDIAVLMRGAAPAIRDFIQAAINPLVERIDELERDLAAAKAQDIQALVETAVAEAVKTLPKPQDGKSVTVEDVAPLIAEAVNTAVAALPPAEKGDPGPPGKLPVARRWEDRVHYEGDVCLFDGSTWQAQRDTGRAPPHDDWICIARAGKDGDPGKGFNICGTYDAEQCYGFLDVVSLNGASFAARKDNPGACPGEGWQLVAAQGKQGKPGRTEKGDTGLRGLPGPAVQDIDISEDGLLTLKNADGSEVTCDLYPILAKVV